ncbi:MULTISPECIES: ABC transporter ATP-binding protein [Mammaliicoccus]|uniref:ABC transporter ATP-binding protein/permease n=1 Tax=Mammaliicoccus sciuri TaxID=1296 RepID=A0AAW5LPM0_MAMSC|nr:MULTISPECIES: ABC transporter ATP-binding protein [Mammaliicoccus]KTT81093.1 multidrug ABC transporter ATP-binding protein [Mammaliicoccus sciuri]MBA1396329.1 ATP-binding cassette domain-containing protein [Mammaliicoccus sciuri]MBG9205330.1 ABC transporter ATP-binding protein [Mammaliicoccus sciuri]MBG9209924.1 ABC transporter ATP-binding protein [Mammaliicoccus sciuri]MBU6088119.1 ABC transporter ATP-binding protein/permease [Mammaliicoccus sciuri]
MSLRNPYGHKSVFKDENRTQHPTKKKKRARDTKGTLLNIWKLIDEKRIQLIVVILMIICSSILSLVGPFLIGHIIDTKIIPKELNGLPQYIILLAIVYIMLSVTSYIGSFMMVSIAQRTVYLLRNQLFKHFQTLPVAYYDQKQHGELMSRMQNDIENVSQVLNSSFIQFTSSVVTLIGTLSIMLYLSPLLTLLTVIIIPIMFISLRWITARTSVLYALRQKQFGIMNGYIEEIVNGQTVVKAFSQEKYVIDTFNEKAKDVREYSFWSITFGGLIPKVMNYLNNLSFAIVAGIGGILALNQTAGVTVGVIVIFAEYARQFTRPLSDLANQFNTVLSAIAGAERVFDIMDEPSEKDDKEAQDYQNINGEIEFEHVEFKYDPNQKVPTIKDLSFKIHNGESVALVGATGAGKTTIVQLILHYYEVNKGRILIDGIPINKITRESLRSSIGVVLQDSYLFDGTIKDNIMYGTPNATYEKVVEAAKKANAHDFIEALENGYDTVLKGESGSLSQGEKQLISIARCLLQDPKILLLDEATSSIDTVTEIKIQEALDTLMQGRTSVIIAHRLNTVKKADLVFVLSHGELIESGSQDALIEQQGIYYHMLNTNDDEQIKELN